MTKIFFWKLLQMADNTPSAIRNFLHSFRYLAGIVSDIPISLFSIFRPMPVNHR